MSKTPPALHPIEPPESQNEYYSAPFVTLAHFFNAPIGWHFNNRTLLQFQFQYVVEGTAIYQIEDQIFTTNRGDLIYHCPNVIHSVTTLINEPYVCISLLFHFGDSAFPLQQLLGASPFLGNFKDQPLENKLAQIIAHYHQPGLLHQIAYQTLLLQIFHELATLQSTQTPLTKVQEKTNAKLILVRNYIVKHYQNNIQHKDLEQASGLSRNYIIIKFKKMYGMTPFEYLSMIRIERAKEFAIQSNLSISEIAQLVGFADVHTFGRMFKSKTGMSLSQFSNLITRG